MTSETIMSLIASTIAVFALIFSIVVYYATKKNYQQALLNEERDAAKQQGSN